VPVLDYRVCRVDDCTVHVEELETQLQSARRSATVTGRVRCLCKAPCAGVQHTIPLKDCASAGAEKACGSGLWGMLEKAEVDILRCLRAQYNESSEGKVTSECECERCQQDQVGPEIK
jgi:hypothetical protein